MNNAKKNRVDNLAAVKIHGSKGVVVNESVNILSLDIILGISITISILLGIIILG